jgi:hypothetical protein
VVSAVLVHLELKHKGRSSRSHRAAWTDDQTYQAPPTREQRSKGDGGQGRAGHDWTENERTREARRARDAKAGERRPKPRRGKTRRRRPYRRRACQRSVTVKNDAPESRRCARPTT